MISETDCSVLKTAVDVVGFLLMSIFYIALAIARLFLPSTYRPVKKLDGEVILITGGGGGLGRLLALRLAKQNASIVVWDVNYQGVEETVKMVEIEGGKVHGYKCDLTDREDVYRVAERTAKEVGQVSILINNAGVVSGYLLLDTPDHLIQRTFEVNAIAHFWTAKAFLPKMIEDNHGHIVTIASMAGHTGTKKLVDYCSSKFAAVGFDEALRVEMEGLGITGVKTTLVCPYFIQSTGMFNDAHSRFMSKLNSTDVADRIVLGILREEIYVFIPAIFRYVFWTKWIFPWTVVSMYLRNLVPDASPTQTAPRTESSSTESSSTESSSTKIESNMKNIISNANVSQRIRVTERNL